MNRPAGLLTIVALVGTVVPARAASQGDTAARISGRAASAYNGVPLADVTISVAGARRFAVTDSTGVFRLDGLPSGDQKLRISYHGRPTEEFDVVLRGDRTEKLVILLDVEALDLAPVVVMERRPLAWRNLAGFYERRAWYGGTARFFTREDIDDSGAETLSALLTVAGITIRCWNQCVPTRFIEGRFCVVPISMDGLPVWEYDFETIPADSIAAVEVYREWPMNNPLGSITPGALGTHDGDAFPYRMCGSVQIWMR